MFGSGTFGNPTVARGVLDTTVRLLTILPLSTSPLLSTHPTTAPQGDLNHHTPPAALDSLKLNSEKQRDLPCP